VVATWMLMHVVVGVAGYTDDDGGENLLLYCLFLEKRNWYKRFEFEYLNFVKQSLLAS